MKIDSKIEPQMSENAMAVLNRRYLSKDEKGKIIEDPRGMFERVALNIAVADANYGAGKKDVKGSAREFYEMMASLEFLPNSPTLMNAGKELQQLSACFVLPINDSLDDIFETVKNTALIHKSGGGTGFSFSRIRPKNDMVRSTRGVSSGPISFMSVFNAATEIIKQGGTRRGANMAILRVDHPDIEDFITAKTDNTALTNFNISVGITEKFMEAVLYEEDYELVNPHTGKVAKTLKAHEVFSSIIYQAWKNGEPGIVFLDRINKENPTPKAGEIESTNPCGEQPLLPFESCNLGSINLTKFVKGGKIDWEHLREVVHTSVHFLDNVIDMNSFPLKVIEEMTKANRKIGLGVMGFGHMLTMMNIGYNTMAGLEMGERVMKFIQTEARNASGLLAESRGVFPNWKESIYAEQGVKLRNSTTTTIAPTGTIAMIANCSTGIEPIFSLAYVKSVMDNDRLIYVDEYFLDRVKDEPYYDQAFVDRLVTTGRLSGLDEVPEELKGVFVSSYDISPLWHVKMQAAFQKYTDNAVSKTVNMPPEATEEDVKEAYIQAYKMGCKGVTIYRSGSRDGEVLTSGLGTNGKEKDQVKYIKPQPRPKEIHGTTLRMVTGCGNLYVTTNFDRNGPFEVFSQIGRGGGCASSQSEAISRLASLALRCGVDPMEIVEQLKGIHCIQPTMAEGRTVYSCPDGLAQALELQMDNWKLKTVEDEKEAETTLDHFIPSRGNGDMRGICPSCKVGIMVHEGGCDKCLACGYSHRCE